ncbi:dTDP-4-dehydrorhamnose reductase [Oceanidesulfovibrio indonesiensis]|uniref:dTDP-4-dehydrorhamnose reductase n=1 Tax=Oceanidesulfovibrio indonesiensis TaxID=54767 RepID=A0A7M3MJ98_9BACT|nr:dTDP-4-dehydrorhamnose reductase [Oceanidesulfovibrio indonesiensis]TVM19845.1 dTDP-4-dehydrorhamnose reductase [Oceanidesulfovibrio indonesiensis]
MSEAVNGTRALVLGGVTGMLGQSLVTVLEKAGWDVVAQSRHDVDVTKHSALDEYIADHKPDVVYNAIAYTAVDLAEDETAAAYELNKQLPAALGRSSKKQGFKLIHYSTDFAFDGRKQKPYVETDETHPLCVYGKSKIDGEKALLATEAPGALILRTAWLFGPGRKNFVQTILNLARERDQLNVVHDQIGSPTYTPDLARYSVELVNAGGEGIYHLVNSGQASWCELAAEAVHLAGLSCAIRAIPSSEYPQKATRPPYSVLSTEAFVNKTGTTPRPWVQALREYVFKDLGEIA